VSFRISLILIIVIAIGVPIGSFLLLSQDSDLETNQQRRTFLYKVPEEKINSIEIISKENKIKFKKSEKPSWQIIDGDKTFPVNPTRWSGVTFLLKGARIQREIPAENINLSEFGLLPPEHKVIIGFDDNTSINIDFGDLSPDSTHQYVNFNNEGTIYTLHTSFGYVLSDLLNNPPMPDWVYSFEENSVDEILLYESGQLKNAFGRNIFNDNPSQWMICTISIDDVTGDNILLEEPCNGKKVADNLRIEKFLNLVQSPKILAVEEVALETQEDFQRYGITKESIYIYLRNNTFSENGSLIIRPITISLSNLSAKEISAVFQDSRDVVSVDSEWANQVHQLIKYP